MQVTHLEQTHHPGRKELTGRTTTVAEMVIKDDSVFYENVAHIKCESSVEGYISQNYTTIFLDPLSRSSAHQLYYITSGVVILL